MITAVALVAIVALALRWIVLASRIGLVDADEAVVGLMARHALHGQYPAFFWGQAQGGTIEPLLVSLSFRIFGVNGFALKIVPLTLFASSSFLVWRIGLRTVGRRASAIAVAFFWVGSTTFVWWSTKARGHYSPLLAIELVVLLLILRIVQDEPNEEGRDKRLDAAILGLFLGVGWWESPQILYVALPAVLWVLWHLRGRVTALWPALPSAFVGALPWLAHNVTHGWDSSSSVSAIKFATFSKRLPRFFTTELPRALGFRMPITHQWIPPVVGVAAYAICLAIFVISLRRKRFPLLILIALSYPLLFALFPTNTSDDGRYVFFLWPVIALLAGAGAGALWARSHRATVLVIVLVASLSFVGVDRMIERAPRWSRWDVSLPAGLNPLVRALESESIRYAYAPYAIAYPITFSSGERIIATPIKTARYQPYAEAVMNSSRPAYIFVDALTLREFELAYHTAGIDPACRVVAGFSLCRPDRSIALDTIEELIK